MVPADILISLVFILFHVITSPPLSLSLCIYLKYPLLSFDQYLHALGCHLLQLAFHDYDVQQISAVFLFFWGNKIESKKDFYGLKIFLLTDNITLSTDRTLLTK